MNEIERAIEYLLPITNHPTMTGEYCKNLKIALASLREKLEREKGCGFCNTGAHRILSNALYCPRCGKRLEEKNGGENHNG